jgi:hypothetical protein
MELATGGVESQLLDIDREALNIQVEDTLAAYKRQMGVAQETATAASTPTVEVDTSAEKTLGPSEKPKVLE